MIDTDTGSGSFGNHPWNWFRALSSVLRVLLTALTLAIAAVGCGGARTSPVTGVVRLDGKPLAGASIQFITAGSGRTATGETDKDGQFTMSTFEPRDGVLPGSYKVVISPPIGTADTAQYATTEDAMAAAAKAPAKKSATSGFPAKYARADLTPLTQEVPVNENLTFDLKSE